MINNIVNIFIKNNIINKDDADIYRYGLFVILYLKMKKVEKRF